MKKFFTTTCAAALTVVTLGTASAPVLAAPLSKLNIETQKATSDLVQVQYRRRDNDRRHRNDRGFHRRGGKPYYNGHRGYRKPRRGYRQHNGFWFPRDAFAATIIGGVLGTMMQNDRPRYSRHVAWCNDHYRSYRASDNTFQPYHGPRRQCISPYHR